MSMRGFQSWEIENKNKSEHGCIHSEPSTREIPADFETVHYAHGQRKSASFVKKSSETTMSRRGNNVRGPTSALTEFLRVSLRV